MKFMQNTFLCNMLYSTFERSLERLIFFCRELAFLKGFSFFAHNGVLLCLNWNDLLSTEKDFRKIPNKSSKRGSQLQTPILSVIDGLPFYLAISFSGSAAAPDEMGGWSLKIEVREVAWQQGRQEAHRTLNTFVL